MGYCRKNSKHKKVRKLNNQIGSVGSDYFQNYVTNFVLANLYKKLDEHLKCKYCKYFEVKFRKKY